MSELKMKIECSLSAPLVAIVGGGCAGTLVAANLLRGSDGPLRIVMIERSGRFGMLTDAFSRSARCAGANCGRRPPSGRFALRLSAWRTRLSDRWTRSL